MTGFPVALFELQDQQVSEIITEGFLPGFEPHCNLIENLCRGIEACDNDQCQNSKSGLESSDERLTICSAGFYQPPLPIKVGGTTRAVIMLGRRHGERDENQYLSEAMHAQFFTVKAIEWLYYLLQEEERARTIVETTTHEIQTRLQGVVAAAENLITEIQTSNREETVSAARAVLDNALALDTVVQTLGPHLEQYDFDRQPITPLLVNAQRIYQDEANRRGIEINVKLEGEGHSSSQILMSRRHLELAINNLVHNAIKYSYRGTARLRFVTISGQPSQEGYIITISNYGVGILPEEYRAIFQEGYQGKLTRGEYRTGSGKGLYLAQGVIERHHGYIKVESRPVAEPSGALGGKPHLNKFIVFLPKQQKEGK